MRLIVLHEVVSFLPKRQIINYYIKFNKNEGSICIPSNAFDVANFVAEFDTVVFIGMFQQLRPESGGDKLGVFRQLMDHVGNSFSMLCIQGL